MEVVVRAARFSRAWGPGGALRLALITGLLYLAASHYVMVLTEPVGTGAGFWPGAGITVAALLVARPVTWPAILVAIALAEVAHDLTMGFGLAPSLWWGAGNVVVPLVAAWLVRRSGAVHLGRVRALATFVLAAVVAAPLAGGLVGAVGTVVNGSSFSYPAVVGRWAVGDGLGILTITPLVLMLRRREDRLGLLRPEPVAVLALTALLAAVVFTPAGVIADTRMPYLMIPPLMWAAARLGALGAAASCFILAQAANLATAFGYGPFAAIGASDAETVLLMQLNIAAVTVAALVLGARTTEHAELAHQLGVQRRLEAEREAAARHYQRMIENEALELHDDVVQGLAAAGLALELGRIDEASAAVRHSTGKAQRIVSDLLAATREAGPIGPGDLRRRTLPPE